jgi:hypothetical protein
MKTFLLFSGMLCVVLFSSSGAACGRHENVKYPVLNALNGYIYFNEVLLEPEGEQGFDEVSLVICFYDNRTDKPVTVGELPYLAATGTVHSAFFGDSIAEKNNQLVVIHGVEIRADTGISYVGDYYSVHVYNVAPGGYEFNDRVFQYFGYGGDVVNNYDENKYVYRYPYKTETAVRREISTDYYKSWMAGEGFNCYIGNPAPLYGLPHPSESALSTVSAGKTVARIDATAGWVKVSGENDYKQRFTGWLKREEVNGNCGISQ